MITLSVRKAKNLREKVMGLIGKNKPISFMLSTRFGIHTFGLKFPIDVLILNEENKVVFLKKNLMPWRIFLWNPTYDKVLELPEGTIVKKKIKINDEIFLKESL